MNMCIPIVGLVALFLSVAAAQTPVHCDHNLRPSPLPKASDLVRLVDSNKVSACQSLQPSGDGTASAVFQGYVLRGAFDPSSLRNAATQCQQAVDMIVSQCILNSTTFGGEFKGDGSTFNLTNVRAPDSPILSGIGAQPTTLHTSRTKTPDSSGIPSTRSRGSSSSSPLLSTEILSVATTPSASRSPAVATTTPSKGKQDTPSPLTASSMSTPSATQTNAVAFHIPTSTATVSLSLSLPTATASNTVAAGYTATNPKNPKETVGFASTTIPPAQRSNLPDSSDHDPALLLLGGLPCLIFGPVLIFPLSSVPWLVPSMFPAPPQLGGSNGASMPYPTSFDAAETADPISQDGNTIYFAPTTSPVSSAPLPTQTSTVSPTRSAGPKSSASTITSTTSSVASLTPPTKASSPGSSSSKTSTRSSSISAAPSGTLNCHQNVPTGGPSGQDIAKSLKENNGIANVCAAEFNGSGNSKQETFNHGQLNIVVSRSSKDNALRYCKDAMNAIINVCVLGSHDYGGVWTLGGEEYNITNMAFPDNPLIPGADQGSQPSTTKKPTQTKPLPTLQPARTVTTNGAICVLQPGSNNPVCNPTDTPTPNHGGTNIHVNKGCISINGSPRCQDSPPYSKNPLFHEIFFFDLLTTAEDVANQNQPYSQATIYANFNAGDTVADNVTPGCELSARWPSNYGDVYFGEDNCLYDSGGNRIYDECCKGSTSASIQNPYQKIALCYKEEVDVLVPVALKYTIFINGWASDGGAALRKQAKGCGLLTDWKFQTTTEVKPGSSSSGAKHRSYHYVATFTLPAFVEGCVGRAIKSAGGPGGFNC
ncbi:MAG: hypothetical protein M1813_001598 [Trichoglossum hirsutum]|nr:MAG: hypothetical protein M1813_001598 [Trichoglossum hirsutum]